MKHMIALLSIIFILAAPACSAVPPAVNTPAADTLPTLPGSSNGVASVTRTSTSQPTSAPTAAPTAAAPSGPTAVPTVLAQPVATSIPVQQVTSVPALDGEAFAQQLFQAMEARNFDKLATLMGPRFSIVTQNQSLYDYAAADALAQLRLSWLASGSVPVTHWGYDVPSLLNGKDPLAEWGPVANVVRAVYMTGLNSAADSEAIFVIGRDSNGRHYWHGIMLPENGRYFTTRLPTGDLDAFTVALFKAMESKDFAKLALMMGPRFSIVTQNRSLYDYPAGEALAELRKSWLSDASQPAAIYATDVVTLLNGKNPLGEWGPVANVVRAVHVSGLGKLGDSEAVMVIGRDAAGKYYWHGILTPENGRYFVGLEPVGDALPTDVKMVQAIEAVRMRSGPGFNYDMEGLMRAGETARVSGVSADGQWWQVFCTMDASGRCWVTADPTLVAVIPAP